MTTSIQYSEFIERFQQFKALFNLIAQMYRTRKKFDKEKKKTSNIIQYSVRYTCSVKI